MGIELLSTGDQRPSRNHLKVVCCSPGLHELLDILHPAHGHARTRHLCARLLFDADIAIERRARRSAEDSRRQSWRGSAQEVSLSVKCQIDCSISLPAKRWPLKTEMSETELSK